MSRGTDLFRVAAIVVLYNPDDDLIRNICSFSKSVDVLYLYKNSPVHPSMHKDIEFHFGNKLCWLGDEINQGIGAALNCGIREALKHHYRFILTMDQDSFFPEGHFEKYLSVVRSEDGYLLFSPNHVVAGRLQFNPIDKPYWVMTSGNLLRLDMLDPMEFFCEKFFIDGVDIEYCMRIRFLGHKFKIVHDAHLIHGLGDIRLAHFFGKTIGITNHGPIRRYYIFRNYLAIIRDARGDTFNYRVRLARALTSFLLVPILFEKDKYNKTKMACKGVVDFLKGNFGRLNDD